MPKSYSATANRRGIKIGNVVGSALFAVVGAGLFFIAAVIPWLQTLEAQEWVATPCKIISSDLDSRTLDNSTSYRVNIQYQFELEGRSYQNNRYDFAGHWSSRDSQIDILREYPQGSEATCFVNPEYPIEVVLNRDYTVGGLIIALALLFTFLGLLGFVYEIWYR